MADIEQIRSALIRLAERYSAGERSVLWPAINEVREQLVCLMDETSERHSADLEYLLVRCEALGRLVVN